MRGHAGCVAKCFVGVTGCLPRGLGGWGGVAGDAFRASTRDIIAANGLMTPEVVAALEVFNRLYRDVGPGDSYTLRYEPAVAAPWRAAAAAAAAAAAGGGGGDDGGDGGGRVVLELNGETLGAVHGGAFAHALFSVWFGEKPFMERLKADLLSGSCVEARG
jgi:hypothetical protein